MVYIENSPYLQNIKVTLQIHSVVDAVRFACVINDIPVQTVEVTSWKKDVLGNGKADKQTIMQFAKTKWGDELITNQDIADASAICQYGLIRMLK
jgi:Holliday junction resolvasome RuvABC endonuclease subunit